jgi:hypothetical protein
MDNFMDEEEDLITEEKTDNGKIENQLDEDLIEKDTKDDNFHSEQMGLF